MRDFSARAAALVPTNRAPTDAAASASAGKFPKLALKSQVTFRSSSPLLFTLPKPLRVRSLSQDGSRQVLPQQDREHEARDHPRPGRSPTVRSPTERLQLPRPLVTRRAGPAATARLVRGRGGQGHGHQEGARQGASGRQIRGRRLGQRRHQQAHRRQARDAALRLVQAGEDAALVGGPAGLADDGGEGAGQHLRHDRRPGPADQGDQGGYRARAQAPGAVRVARHRPAQGGAAVRPAGDGQDAAGARRGPPHRLQVHPRVGLGAGAEVHRRGQPHGARAVRHGARARAQHHLHGRDRQHRQLARRGQRRRRLRGAAHHARAAQPARRLRAHQEHQGRHGHQPPRHPRPGPAAAGAHRPQDRVPPAHRRGPRRHPAHPLALHEPDARHQPDQDRREDERLLRRRAQGRVHRGRHVRPARAPRARDAGGLRPGHGQGAEQARRQGGEPGEAVEVIKANCMAFGASLD